MPSKKSAKDAAIQQLSPVLGSEAVVALVTLGIEALAAVVLVTVVVVADLVAAAGFSMGIVDGSAAGSTVAGSAPGAEGPSPGTSGSPVSPADAVASTDSIVTCAATEPSAFTTPPAPKAPPAGATKRAGCKRAAQAGDTAVGARRIQPGRIDGKLAGRATAGSPAQQTHAIGAHARPGARASGDNAPPRRERQDRPRSRRPPAHPRCRRRRPGASTLQPSTASVPDT